MKTSRTYTHPKTFKRRRPTSTTITSSNTNDVWRSLHLFVVLVIMVDIAAALLPKDRNPGFLIPSQVLSQRNSPKTTIETSTRRQHNANSFNYNILIPSQVRLHSSPQQNDAATPAAAAGNTTKAYSPPSTPNNPEVSKRRRRRQRQIPNAQKKTNRKFGNLPDVYWRSMSIEDLRQHPKFQALPFPSTIRQLQKLEDIRQFRQDSWQWDAVHLGRCTTSQAVAALGFLEPEAGRVLGVPKSWQRGGLGAYMRLSQQPIRTLEEMNDVLIDNNIDRETKRPPTNLWGDSASGHFAARYSAIVTENEINNRKHVLRQYNFSNLNVRTMWGNAQEATALLTALNFFWRHDPDIQLKEVGMCGAGLTSIDGVDGLLLGATPDGLLVYPNGTVEALEVRVFWTVNG